jgi:uncharacterized RDD family membrane protein YckC
MQEENQAKPQNQNPNPPDPVQSTPPQPNQTVDPVASQQTGGGSSQTAAEPAGFWIRFLAAIIDGIILSIVGSVVNVVFGGAMGAATLTQPSDSAATAGLLAGLFGIGMILSMVIQLGYYVILTGIYGATLGKMILGLRVVDTSGQKIGIGKAVLREIIGKFVSGLVFGLGYIWVAFDEKKQGWHDKIAGTYVVKVR